MPLTDLFVASEAEVRELDDDDIPLEIFPAMEAKGIEHVKLAQLQCILTGRDYDGSLIDDFELVRQRSDDGPWIWRLPRPLTDALAELRGIRIDQVAHQWGATEEFQAEVRFGGWNQYLVTCVLHDIVELAQQARAEGKEVFLWVCL